MTLNDGTISHRKDFIGENKRGKIITILGDTRNPEQNKTFVENSDILIHEDTFDKDKVDLAHQYFHSTTSAFASLAKECNEKKLALTHISSRYKKEDDHKLLTKAQMIF